MRVIDSHCHLGYWPFPQDNLSASELAAGLRSAGIDKGICSSGLAIVYDFREGNRRLDEAVAEHPELLGYVTVNLNYPDEGIAEVDRYRRRPGFVGAKIHPMYSRQPLSTPAGRRVVAALAERHCPLLVHTYSSAIESPWAVVPVAKEYPELPIIMAHMGGDRWWEGLEAAGESPNLHVDPCATWADADKVAWAVRKLGAERVLFGSDYPLFDAGYTLGMIEDAEIADEERELILYGNAERIFGIR